MEGKENGEMELKDLCGKHILSGIETGVVKQDGEQCNYIKFCLDGVCYLAVEDPSDGWRSYCQELIITSEPCKIKIPNVEVIGTMNYDEFNERDDDVLTLIDAITGKEVLSVGTLSFDDWYPCCLMEWTPENLSCNIGREE